MPRLFADYVTTGVYELETKDFVKKNGDVHIAHHAFHEKNGMIMFYTPWCEYSRNLRNVWSALGQAGGMRYVFAAVNCEENRGIANALNIRGFPTLKFVNQDGTLNQYNGGRSLSDLTTFMVNSTGINTGSQNNLHSSNFHYNTGTFDKAHTSQSHLNNYQDAFDYTPYISLAEPIRISEHFHASRGRVGVDPRKQKYTYSTFRLPEEKYYEPNPTKRAQNPRPQY